MTTTSFGQFDGLYEFDGGGDGTSWDDASNWEQKLDPFGTMISGDPATPPDAVTSADIPLAGVVVDSAGQFARNVQIGTAAGAGSLSIVSGGELTLLDMRIGNDTNPGSLDISGGLLDVAASGGDIEVGVGSAGTMTMSAGTANAADDFVIGTDSSFTMTGGTVNVGDRLVLEDNATLSLDNGDIIADDDFFFFGNSQITVNSGTLVVADKLRFDDDDLLNGKLTINGGVVRSNEFGVEVDGLLTDFRGVVEINGDGVFQVELSGGSGSPISQLSVSTAHALIAEGVHLTTSEAFPLNVRTVVVPDFFGDPNATFVEIFVAPEPSSLMLLGLAGFGFVMRRKKA